MLTRTQPPPLTACPQCSSLFCGPYSCRFSGITHARARTIDAENRYAEHMIRRDQLQRLTGAPS